MIFSYHFLPISMLEEPFLYIFLRKVVIFLKKYAIFPRKFRLVYGKKGKTDRKKYIDLIDDMCCGFYGIYRI